MIVRDRPSPQALAACALATSEDFSLISLSYISAWQLEASAGPCGPITPGTPAGPLGPASPRHSTTASDTPSWPSRIATTAMGIQSLFTIVHPSPPESVQHRTISPYPSSASRSRTLCVCCRVTAGCLAGRPPTPRRLEVRPRLLAHRLLAQIRCAAARWGEDLFRKRAPRETALRLWAALRRTTTLNVIYYVSRTTARVKGHGLRAGALDALTGGN